MSSNTNETSYLIGDVTNGRQAYEKGDKSGSKIFHENKEQHQTEGGMLKPIIFGGLDGILTAFAIVAGSAGGQLSPNTVLILGFSNIFADALSMGVGEFLSSKAENEWILSERTREMWEMENYPEGEIKEMIDIYEEKGMSQDDAKLVIETMAKYKDFFVDIMMVHELELSVPEDDHIQESFREGVVMFCSFATFGAFPLLGYVIIPLCFPDLSADVLFASACIVTGIVLFLMGCVKSVFSSSRWFYCGIETLLLGGACATVAYVIGQ
jgi:VIT1/CCC1 family predicted Fe2+/Mn2+ transporter